jgi:tripartite ATP-independent transporter DctP family solute receptor
MSSKQIKRQSGKKSSTSDRVFTRRDTLKSGLAAGAGLAFGVFGIIGKASAAPVSMRFGSDSPIGAPHTKSALVLKELVERRTSGRVQVTIFPDSQLGSNQTMTNSIKAGTLDGVVTDVSHISAAVAEMDVFNLPFLYKDTDHVLRFANSGVGKQLKPKVDEAFTCELLGFASDGSRNLWNGKRPIRTPADVTGLKFGVQASKIQRDTILAFGGIPTVVGLKDLYTALQTGLIDGSDKTMADILQVKLYQVTKYLTLTNHYSIVSAMIVSRKFMDRLEPKDREIVREAAIPAVKAQIDDVLKSENDTIAFLKDKGGMQIIPMENPKAFSDKLDSVYKEASARIGADLVNAARRFA